MEFKDIATVSGKGGLFKVLKPGRTGVVLESIDKSKKRFITNLNHQVSVLEEISIYTTTSEGSVPLKDIMVRIRDEFDDDPGVDKDSSPEELKSFFEFICPDHDEDRVYVSDIKKIIGWYKTIYEFHPEVLKDEKGDQ